MAFTSRIISYRVQSFCANKSTVKTPLEKCDIILLQETLLSAFNVNEVDGILQNNEISCYTTVNISNSLLRGRPFRGLGIIWKTKDKISGFSAFLTEKIMGLC